MNKMKQLIEELLVFGLYHNLLELLDKDQIRNQLLILLLEDEPYSGEITYKVEETPTRLLNEILDLAVKKDIINDSLSERDILDAKIMAQLLPRQSEVSHIVESIKKKDGIEKATDYYYHLSKMSNYIRTDRVAKNRYWKTKTVYGELEITINLSKPEKDPKDIAKAKLMPQSNYPKCFLCKENVGYIGRSDYPARSNHRILPLILNEESWFLQYSPYVYYNEHAIIFKKEHEPMKITIDSFKRLVDFVEIMPHYFIGSNADLPIVGGSILSHDHFQGGRHRFPMVDAEVLYEYELKKYPEVSIKRLRWPLSILRLASYNKKELASFAFEIFEKWRVYRDESVEIIDYSIIDGIRVPHNTITPIARINDEGLFEMDLALRNNRQDKAHKDGIFHPHAHLHHIKKENIGLIEVMGLAVLPARLDKDIVILGKILQGKESINIVETNMPHHLNWIKTIIKTYGIVLEENEAQKILEEEVGKRFKEALDCSGVYKQTEIGQKAFNRFIEKILI